MIDFEKLTRPIIGIENRTAQETFAIMVDRIHSATQPTVDAGAKPVGWQYREKGDTRWHPMHEDAKEADFQRDICDYRPVYASLSQHQVSKDDVIEKCASLVENNWMHGWRVVIDIIRQLKTSNGR